MTDINIFIQGILVCLHRKIPALISRKYYCSWITKL